MTCTNKHRQEESGQRCEERDAVRMLAQHLFGQLDQPIHTARSLHDTRTGDGSNDDVNHVGGRCARFHTKAKHKDGQADARDGTQGKATVSRAEPQSTQHDTELKNHD